MKSLHFNLWYRLLVIMAAIWAGSLSAHAQAADENRPAPTEGPAPIRISSDSLISDNKAKTAEFIGNVKAVQEDTVITGERLKIFFSGTRDDQPSLAIAGDSLSKIIVRGNVRIEFENKVAFTEEAVYHTINQVLTLTGKGSRVISGKDSISGAKIILYRADGRIEVESDEDKRVEAIIFSKETTDSADGLE